MLFWRLQMCTVSRTRTFTVLKFRNWNTLWSTSYTRQAWHIPIEVRWLCSEERMRSAWCVSLSYLDIDLTALSWLTDRFKEAMGETQSKSRDSTVKSS